MLAVELDADGGRSAPEVVRRALVEERLVLNATGPTTVRLLPPLIDRAPSATTRSRACARLPDPDRRGYCGAAHPVVPR